MSPNLFRIGSFGTGTGHMSHVMQIESAVAYVMDALRTMDAGGLASVEVREDAQEAYARRLHDPVKDTVWAVGGCDSWYLDRSGEPSAVWPSSAWHYRKWTRRFDVGAYRVVRREPAPRRSPGVRRSSRKSASAPIGASALASASAILGG